MQDTLMFHPLDVGDRNFTVTFTKLDGTIRTMENCNLFSPKDQGQSQQQKAAYLMSLVGKECIHCWTDKGWRSFTVSNVIEVN